ncbi:MAG: tryptophan--tRNA ligase [Clostridiales bacterium]|jgi:tryptophanyl-tRNA synthetase|nr:tryptophan--tRNA ligase [Clostridiales bacterium]
MEQERKTIYSAIQPTGIITIGNYIGAINNWVKFLDDFNSIFAIADLHSLTVRQNPTEYRQRGLSFFAQLIASGLDPEKCILYFQSHVPAHAELTWLLNCYTYVGEMQRMTQFKDKSAKNEDNINMGLLDYPVLMAADILLYQSHYVPIGIDQQQHMEITRDIAIRFNNLYGDTFTVPEGYYPKVGAKIFSLQDPTAKMSKSDPDPNGSISIIEEPDSIARKIRRAVTDSETEVRYDVENKPGVSNLLVILSVMSRQSLESVIDKYTGYSYKELKEAVAESIIEHFAPIRAEYARLMKDKAYLLETAKEGASKAAYLASKTLRKVKRKMGLVELK